uniref:Myosin XVA n=1 Tax=Calidris pygmaea TaxID=425635 RepID=A0A8C3J956_9CHAR
KLQPPGLPSARSEALSLFQLVGGKVQDLAPQSPAHSLPVAGGRTSLSLWQILRFMGDPGLGGPQETLFGNYIVQKGLSVPGLRDELLAQAANQVWRNTNVNNEERGWLLLAACLTHGGEGHPGVSRGSGEVALPHPSPWSPSPPGIAKACEQNLQKTLQFGGRSLFPSSMELKAMVVRTGARGCGGIPSACPHAQVALDVIEELCNEMGLQHPEAFDEYILFVVTDRGQSVRPLTRREYVLDVAAETERRDTSYTFWCRRVVWSQPLKFDNELYVTVHYNQVLPDYLKGLFTILPPARAGEQHFPQVAKLAALQHRAKDRGTSHGREVQDYVPPQLFRLLKAQSWLHMVTQHMQQAQALRLLSAYPMFGSSFFYIQSCSNNAIVSPCILAVNQNGLNFLSKETHVGGGAGGGARRPVGTTQPPLRPAAGSDPGGTVRCEGRWWGDGRGQRPQVWPQLASSACPCPPCPSDAAPPATHPVPVCARSSSWSPWGTRGFQGLVGHLPCPLQEPIAKFSLKEIQSTRTQRPTAGSSSPYVEITLGDLLAQGITQLQLEQVGDTQGCVCVRVSPACWGSRRGGTATNSVCVSPPLILGRAWSCAAWWPRTWSGCWEPGRRG